jgi:hypothetical protein
MSLRLAFDLDGVLADMEGELTRQAETLFGEGMTRALLAGPAAAPASDGPPKNGDAKDPRPGGDEVLSPAESSSGDDGPPLSKLQMTTRQTRRLWQHVQSIDNFWETLEELEPGAISRLAATAADRRWEIIFLTRRPASAGSTAQVQTQRWLECKGFTLPSVYVVQGSRGRIAASLNLDIVVDDTPANCLDVVVDSHARAILVWREDEKLLPTAAKRLGIGVVTTVDECLHILTQVDAPPEERPRVMTRVMRLLGLKDPATRSIT